MSLLDKRHQGFTNPFGLNQRVINTDDATAAQEAARALSAAGPDPATVLDTHTGQHRTYWGGADVTENPFFANTIGKGWFG